MKDLKLNKKEFDSVLDSINAVVKESNSEKFREDVQKAFDTLRERNRNQDPLGAGDSVTDAAKEIIDKGERVSSDENLTLTTHDVQDKFADIDSGETRYGMITNPFATIEGDGVVDKSDLISDPDSPGLRYSKGKLRYDLYPPDAHAEVVRVFTEGAKKYADRNWEKGMKWSECIRALHSHLVKFELKEDKDDELDCYHIAMVAWNAVVLMAYQLRNVGTDDRIEVYDDLSSLRLNGEGQNVVQPPHVTANTQISDGGVVNFTPLEKVEVSEENDKPWNRRISVASNE